MCGGFWEILEREQNKRMKKIENGMCGGKMSVICRLICVLDLGL